MEISLIIKLYNREINISWKMNDELTYVHLNVQYIKAVRKKIKSY